MVDFKRYLGLKGRYPVFQKFKERVLTPSLDSINASTDLQVNYETWKRGQAVCGLIFHIQRLSPQAKPLPAPMKTLAVMAPPTVTAIPDPPARSSEEQSFLDLLARHQISEADALLAVQTHGWVGAMDIFGYVRQEVLQRKGTAEEIRNVPAYLARCLREGYGRKGELEREAEQAQAEQAEHQAQRQAAALAAQVAQDEIRIRENATIKEQIAAAKARWVTLSEAEQAALEQRFTHEEPLWARLSADSMMRIKAFERWLIEQWC